MGDDLQPRLEEAAKHFASENYDACLRLLSTCPTDDAKVQANVAAAEWLRSPTASNLAALVAAAPIDGCLQYEGHELACINAAAALLHAGRAPAARRLLIPLATAAATLQPKARIRVGMLLHLAARRGTASVVKQASELVNRLVADPKVIGSDPALKRQLQLTLADTSSLHSWLGDSSKKEAERAAYYNNLGVEAFGEGKTEIAGLYFAKSLQAAAADSAEACPFIVDAAMCNAGLCQLVKGNATAAAGSLLGAARSMRGSATMWLRIGQALFTAHEQAQSDAERAAISAALERQCCGLHRDGTVPSPFAAAAAYGTGCELDMALLDASCASLRTSLALVTGGRPVAEVAKRLGSGDEVQVVYGTLLHLSAAELGRGNTPLVLHYVNMCFQVEKEAPGTLSVKDKAVMVCYAAEALCTLGKPMEAFSMLQLVELGDVAVAEGCRSDTEALLLNLCITHIVKGNWGKAILLGQLILPNIPSTAARLLALYLEAIQGNGPKAAEVAESIEL